MIVPFALALLATSQPRDEAWNCADPQAQVEMNACAALDFARADAELNAAWRDAIAGQRAGDREIDRSYDRRPTGEARLRDAQRAWILFRDAHCTVQGYDEARGGSMEPMVFNGCRAALTRERIRQLAGGRVPEQ